MSTLRVLYEDNHLLVVDKPAGIATMGTTADVPTIARDAAAYLKVKYQKPGKVFVGIVSRLDSLVSGVLVLARTSKSASRLSEQIRAKTPTKSYLAMVENVLHAPDWVQLNDWIIKDEAHQRMKIVHHGASSINGAQQATLRVRTLASSHLGSPRQAGAGRGRSLVEVDLETGRKHQIRVQLSAAGHPVLGDRKYEGTQKFAPGIALHCYQLSILHPTLRTEMTFTALPGKAWTQAAPDLMGAGLAKLAKAAESKDSGPASNPDSAIHSARLGAPDQ